MLVRTRTAQAAQVIKLRGYGLVFLCVLALLVGLAVASYEKAFTPVVRVTLEADRSGLQLNPPADVKLRGIIVGEVREVDTDGRTARIRLALDPRYAELIPANVSARLLPKTLFGEKYVDLVLPARPARPIRAGDVIPQDRSRVAIEVERVVNDLMPLLRTLKPAELNATLNALATALEGRGDRLGENLERLDRYVKEFNPHLEALKRDITLLADTADTYQEAAPDILRIARNLTTAGATVTQQREQLQALFTEVTGASTTAEQVLAENERRLIQVGRVQRPTLALLARYSPEYPCLLGGLVRAEQRLEDAFHDGALNITLEVVPPRPGYQPGEEPKYLDRRGPNCYGLPDNPPFPAPYEPIKDGTKPHTGVGDFLVFPGSTPRVTGTSAEQGVVGALVAPVMGVPADQVPPVATLLFGPMARGTVVNVA
ncbi:MCE family protein [Carbonactinospora thermoautotrophica]|uniref:MCE family protein n=1 Tax=Carbonactinospora thermoautotrophica TaxID=1469144 RepID=UPI00082C575E|nr:MCE family protein [Carbonactinospora thermoautotrophica]